VIQVESLRRVYDSRVAVDGLSFTARPGEIFGLLGPNGAGKTTTIGCISGLLEPFSGRSW
jgi:ABC-2 type transport system ATP-binding protein